ERYTYLMVMMEFQNRRVLLLLNKDVPISSPPPPPTASSTPAMAMYGSSSLQVPARPMFSSNIAYAFIILLTTLFFLAFILLFLRQFSSSGSRSRCSEETTEKWALPTVAYSRGKRKVKEQEEECVICLEELREGETVKMIPHCKHVFHPNCIDTWLLTHVTCPVCRCPKVCEEEENDEGETRIRREVVEIQLQESQTERAVSSDERREATGLRRSLSF
ncbi:hypothetical protein HN51_009851, partial [Arachis hypogaea]